MPKSSLSWDNIHCTLQDWIRETIDLLGFEQMTAVQASTIPMFAGNKDVVVESVTGSGKTIAFVIPILEKIIKDNMIGSRLARGHFYAIIITPTRELSKQIQSVLDKFVDNAPVRISSQLIIGTNSKTVRDDVQNFLDDRPQILVGTPGRVLDFLQSPKVNPKSCNMVVLDEADRLLDVGFLQDVQKVLQILPKQRRTGLFSATISSAGDLIFKTGLRNPVKVKVSQSKTMSPTNLVLNYCVVKPEFKLLELLVTMNDFKYKKAIVYLPTCISVTFFYSFITHLQQKYPNILRPDLRVYSLHGKLPTSARLKTLNNFTETLDQTILLTTDVAARGIDIPEVDLVLQMDPPNSPEVFLHRSGRTGRAQKAGQAITYLNEGREEDYVSLLEVKQVFLTRIGSFLSKKNGRIGSHKLEEFYEKVFVPWILDDRAHFDHSVKSYVAFIRHYSKHSASSIFRLNTLDYIGIAKMYGLLRLPRMPEITQHLNREELEREGRIYADAWLLDPMPVHMDKYAYRDKKAEAKRLKALKELANIKDERRAKLLTKRDNAAWSHKLGTKENKSVRRAKVAAKRKAIEEEIMKESDDEKEETADDWKELVLRDKKRAKMHENVTIQGDFEGL